MRHIILILLMAVCSAGVSAQESFIDKFAGTKGISSVYISKDLLGMMSGKSSGDYDFGVVSYKLTNIQILNSENRKAAKTLREGCLQIIRNNKYKKLMDVTGDGEHSGIYMKTLLKDFRQYVLLNVGDEEVSVVVLTGSLTLQDIKKVIDN